MTVPAYAALWCKSNGSFLEGASHPEELVEHASALGLSALALTDRDGVYGIVRAHVRARERKLPLIVGAQVTVGCESDPLSTIVLLAQDRQGYANLCRLLTAGRRRCDKGESRVTWDEVCEHAAGLIALWGGEASLLVRRAEIRMMSRASCATRSAIGCTRWPRAIAAPTTSRGSPAARARRPHGCPSPRPRGALSPRARRPLQDVLTCIRHGVTLRTAGRLISATTSTTCAAATRSPRSSPTTRARSRARSRSPRAARSRSASCAIAIPPKRCPTA